MKTNWQHQKEAITTEQRNRHRDEHSDELEKQKMHGDAESQRTEKLELKKKHSTGSADTEQSDGD